MSAYSPAAPLAALLLLAACAGPPSDLAAPSTHPSRPHLRPDHGLIEPPAAQPGESRLLPAAPRASRSRPPRPPKPLARIRQCESGGDYRAVSPSGRYRGAYQADDATWAGYGGYARADQAPPAVQDQWAAELQRRRGNRPWPVCGR